MLRKWNTLILVVLLSLFVGCNESDPDGNRSSSDYEVTIVDRESAMEIAQQEIQYELEIDAAASWTSDSRVVDAFPIYIDGIEGISYYECKVTTNEEDAGYILVNTNQTDLIIPEHAEEGKTITEQYRDKARTEDLKIFRYDWFISKAHFTGQRKSLNSEAFLTIGFNQSGQVQAHFNENRRAYGTQTSYHELFSDYRHRAKKKGCNPQYSKSSLEHYYINAKNAVPKYRGKTKSMTAKLKHRYPDHHYTASYAQVPLANGHIAGCGPVAWTIAYAYWATFKGKTALFSGLNFMENQNYTYKNGYPDEVITAYHQLYDDCECFPVGKMTAAGDMTDGIKYAKRNGYPSSTERSYFGEEDRKFLKAYAEIKADKPCMLWMSIDPGVHWKDHFVVVEGVHRHQKKFFVWWTKDIAYRVNLGGGNIVKVIHAKGKNVGTSGVLNAPDSGYHSVGVLYTFTVR